ncbi:MAG: permease prefix domain 1-containing protein, partial [Eubacterium sp.]|nr:permease prefix domain 1-containing protein [Eubacterium sp.]
MEKIMTRQEYIEIVLSQIKNKTAKREVERELQSHIDDRIEYYTDAGYSAEYSENKALSLMGNPDEVGEKLDKLHNNTHYIILAFLFMLFYVVGLITANIKIHDFSIINLVDFVEVSEFSSIVSVLIFASAALCFKFSVKSKSSKALIPFGVISIAGFFISPYALRPACYEIISLITDFPAAVISGDYFFDSGEIFWHLDKLFLTSSLPNIIYYSLVVFVLLLSLVAIVSG